MQLNMEKRSILKNGLFALAATPLAYGGGLIISTLLGGLDDAIFKMQYSGYWWILLIGTYMILLIYFVNEPVIRAKNKRKRMVWVLMLYWKEKLIKEGKGDRIEGESEFVRNSLMERVNGWAWNDREIWKEHFPEEEYPEHIFSIVDNFMVYFEDLKKKWDRGNYNL
jgi:hypothetical protein